MGDQVHYSPGGILKEMERRAGEVAAHLQSCEACTYVLALVRRLTREPTEEETEVVLDALKEWARSKENARSCSPRRANG